MKRRSAAERNRSVEGNRAKVEPRINIAGGARPMSLRLATLILEIARGDDKPPAAGRG